MSNLLTQRRILRPWRPDQVNGLALWLDAADLATITLDGSNNVSQWSDKSGFGRHATQAVSAQRPAYTSGAVNGLNAITLDGTNDYMVGLPLVSADGNYTIFGVVRKLASAGLTYFLSGPAGLAVGVAGNAGRPGFLVNAVNWVNEASDLPVNTTICQSLRRKSSAFSYKRGTVSLSSSLSPNAYGGNYLIGTHSIGQYQNQMICELLHYNADLPDSQITQIEAYLSLKWGIL